MVKMASLEGQHFTLNLNFRVHISAFRAEKIAISRAFEAKNNSQTTFEQLQNNFEKCPKNEIFDTQNNQNIDVNLTESGRF